MDPKLWFPGANLSRPARTDGGSYVEAAPKALWHGTETSGVPSYSTGFWPQMTIHKNVAYQHIPANRAGRALQNRSGGVQTNRANVFQIEVVGFANRLPYYPIMRDVAKWLEEYRGVPRVTTVRWIAYDPDNRPSSYGLDNGVRLTGSQWLNYRGHCAHMHCPENNHGDTGWPFPIFKIFDNGDDELTPEERELLKEVHAALTDPDSLRTNAPFQLVYNGFVRGKHVPNNVSLNVLNRRVDTVEATLQDIKETLETIRSLIQS